MPAHWTGLGCPSASTKSPAGPLPAPVGAGGPGGFDGEVGPEEVERLAGLVVGGDIQLPDVEGLVLVGLELLIFLGGVLFLQDVAGSGVLGGDAGPSLQLDTFAVVEGPRPKPESPEAPASRKGGVPGRCRVSWGESPGGSLAQSSFPSGWADPGIERGGHGLRASRGQERRKERSRRRGTINTGGQIEARIQDLEHPTPAESGETPEYWGYASPRENAAQGKPGPVFSADQAQDFRFSAGGSLGLRPWDRQGLADGARPLGFGGWRGGLDAAGRFIDELPGDSATKNQALAA